MFKEASLTFWTAKKQLIKVVSKTDKKGTIYELVKILGIILNLKKSWQIL